MKLALLRLCAVLVVLPAGCASPGAVAEAPPDWQRIATEDDRERLSAWRSAWTRALAKAQAAGHDDELAREGELLAPDSAIEWKDPQPGAYQCRTLNIGARSEGMLDYVAYPPFACRISRENGLTSFAKTGGSQRPIGFILPYAPTRKVFLGTLQLGDETRALQYGRDRERDLAAVVERIGEKRWRLVFPYPHFESTLDVIELVPQRQPS
jgi:hypothetical protein